MLRLNRVLSFVFIAIGIILIIETAAQGAHGLQVGYLAGVVFIALGLLRRRALRPPGAR
jgi:nitrate reductase NapE component